MDEGDEVIRKLKKGFDHRDHFRVGFTLRSGRHTKQILTKIQPDLNKPVIVSLTSVARSVC